MLSRSLIAFILCFLLAGTSPLPAAEIPAPDFPAMIQQGADLAAKGKWDDSQAVYLKVTDESPIPDYRVQAYEGLTKLYKTLRMPKKAAKAEARLQSEKEFLKKLIPKDSSFYAVQTIAEGDTYAKIAAREGVSQEWLKRANKRKKLIAGKEIKVPVKRYSIVVSKKEKTLSWFREKELLKVYPVAIGKKSTETPEGNFKIISMVANPIWYKLNLQIPPESPENLLGPRWIGLDVKGYGIHGTRSPGTIQRAVSHGCVRMLNRDVEEIFEWLPLGTPVTIE